MDKKIDVVNDLAELTSLQKQKIRKKKYIFISQSASFEQSLAEPSHIISSTPEWENPNNKTSLIVSSVPLIWVAYAMHYAWCVSTKYKVYP